MKRTYKWTVALIVLGFVIAGFFLTIAPAQIPVHYDIHGDIDRWGSKYEFLILPFINLCFGVFMVWLARREGKRDRDMNERIVSIMNNWILILFNVLWGFFMWKAVQTVPGALGELPMKGVLVLLTASFIPMGNIMPKAQRNSAFGLRTKWSTASDHCWQQSQRIGGYVMVGTGVLGVILTAILPVEWGGIALLALILAMAVGCTYASWRIYMRSQNL